MIKHDLGVGLNVPVRIAVYKGPSGGKSPRGVQSSFVLDECARRQDVSDAAQALDAKLVALAEKVSGARA